MFGAVINSILGALINALPNIKLLNYTVPEQLGDIIPNLIASITMYMVTVYIHK